MNIKATILVIDAALRVAVSGPDLPDDFENQPGAAAVELQYPENANLVADPAAAPILKPVLTVTVATSFYCAPCERLKADIAAGKLSAYRIEYAPEPSATGSYPEIAYTQPSGVVMRRTGYDGSTLGRIAADLAKPKTSQSLPGDSAPRTRPAAVWGGRSYTAPVCNRPGCTMCNSIRQQLSTQRWQSAVDLPAGQQPTSADVLGDILQALELSPSDVVADLGCGDGRILIAAVRASGCKAVGVEIDPERADVARTAVRAAGLSDRIDIVTGDARDFQPTHWGVNKLVAYLWPDLLQELRPIIGAVALAVTPFHQVPGLPMQRRGDLWIYAA